MTLLIDGYNLLHVTGLSGGGGTHSFQRSREALLSFLAASLPAAELVLTTIVFDAAEAPPGLPRTVHYLGMTVRYAAEYADADAMIEHLIGEETSPRSLLVVSSDHRIQRAARRRRASFIDSDRWYSELCRRRVEVENPHAGIPAEKLVPQLTPADIAYWVEKFSPSALSVDEAPAATNNPTPTQAPQPELDLKNPFPPGYGEDLLRND